MANIQKELEKFFKSEAGETLIGQIVLKAVDQALKREIRFEDGKTDPGRIVEKTEIWNILDWLVKYLPHVEAAVRGCQADSASARNRATDVRDMLAGFAGLMHEKSIQRIDAITNRELIE